MRSHSSHVCSLSGIWKKSVSCVQRSSGFFFGSRGLNFHFSAARLSFSFSITNRRMSQLSASARSWSNWTASYVRARGIRLTLTGKSNWRPRVWAPGNSVSGGSPGPGDIHAVVVPAIT